MAAEENHDMDVEMTTPISHQDNSSQDVRPGSGAQQRVFDTTELLEMILAWLPLPTLLRVQSVSTQWRDLIQASLTLQQKLFLKPEKRDRVWLAEISNLPALSRPLPRDYRSAMRVLAEIPRISKLMTTYHGLIATPVSLNHLFLDSDPMVRDPNNIDKKVDRGLISEISIDNNLLRTITNHSMRDMFLTQPPVTSLCAEILVYREPLNEIPGGLTFVTRGDLALFSAKVIEPEGVRLHQVAEALEKTGMLHRAESIKLFMSGVVEPTEADMKEVRKRTEEWLRDAKSQNGSSGNLALEANILIGVVYGQYR